MKRMRINERIAATRVVLISSSGENLGEVHRTVAQDAAKKEGLDLVEVSTGTIPVCKICDFGKLQYEKSKQEKHHSHVLTTKEIRVSYNIGDHDLMRQKDKIKAFLADGHKVLFVMITKGRERFAGQGAAKNKFITVVKELAVNPKIADLQESERGFSYLLTP